MAKYCAERTAPSGKGLTAAGRRSRILPERHQRDARLYAACAIVMYIRFVCPSPHPHAAAELGVFQGTGLIDWEDQPAWLADEFRRAYDAAVADLSVPTCVGWRVTADGRRGLCWLRSHSRETVAGFRHLAWVMGEMGVPVAELCSRDPGRIIYRDPAQVVALPYGRMRRAFPRR